MKKFQFKFQSVLKLRQAREDAALRALAAAHRAQQAELQRKLELLKRLDESLRDREDLGRTSIDITAYQVEQDFIVGTKQRIIMADNAILRANRGVEKAMRAYLHTRRQTRVIELLRERAKADFKKEVNKRELKEQDELTVMRARFSDGREEIA